MGRHADTPPEFRRKVLDLARSADREVVKALGISAPSIHTWHRQDRIEKGLVPGPSSEEEKLASHAVGSPSRRPSWQSQGEPRSC